MCHLSQKGKLTNVTHPFREFHSFVHNLIFALGCSNIPIDTILIVEGQIGNSLGIGLQHHMAVKIIAHSHDKVPYIK